MPLAAARAKDRSGLFGLRDDTEYTPEECQYSQMVQHRLEQLLDATCRQLAVMRSYHEDGRLALLSAAPDVDRAGLRREVVEGLLCSMLAFVHDGSPGGPVFQRATRDGLAETQLFGTRYPHIVIERLDVYDRSDRTPLYTEWRLRRTQNQKAETRVNRWLNVADIGMSLAKTLAGAR